MRHDKIVLVILVVILLASFGLNVYQYSLTGKLNSQVNSRWSEVRLGYAVINGTVFNEADSNETYGIGYTGHTDFQLSNVTFRVSNGCPNCNGSQSFVFNVAYHGAGPREPWNATLTIIMFLDGMKNLPRAAFTSGTTPIVGVAWSHDGHFHFFVSVQ